MGDELKAKAGRGRWWKWAAGALVVVLAAAGIAVTVLMRRVEPMLRALIVERLETEFHSRVELDSFHVSVGSGLWAEGKGLRIWAPAKVAEEAAAAGKAQAGPLIAIEEFRFHAPLSYKPGVPVRIPNVELVGMVVDVPARPPSAPNAQPTAGNGAAANRTAGNGKNGGAKPAVAGPELGGSGLMRFVVDSVNCRDARLTMETSKPGKLPLEFAIDRMALTNMSATGAVDFDAVVENPEPRGTVFAKGRFGPWLVDDPGGSAVQGNYKFENADLGVFKGIGGALNSTGSFTGALREMVVDGEADTPNFSLSNFGTAMPLHTKFHARVDGTNGDTWLEPVDATLGRSHFTAQGSVLRMPPAATGETPGHEIALAVNVDQGRIEDFLKLASRTGNVMLTGNLKAKSTFDLKPGTETVEKRMALKGQFALDDADFTSAKVQEKVGQLSMRGEGRPQDAKSGAASDVRSTMQSDYTMAGGIISLPDLVYMVPGAEIDLKGTYGVVDGRLAFTGKAKTEATVSQMVGGWVGALLKPADRIFKKDGAGMEIPIHVDGTREDPQFGIDFGGMKKTSPQRPGEQ